MGHWPNGWRTFWATLAVAILVSLVWIVLSSRPTDIASPSDDDRLVIEAQLSAQPDLVSATMSLVLSMVYTFPAAGESGRLSLEPNSDAVLPRRGLKASPELTVQSPGFYVGVTNEDHKCVYLIQVTDPHYVLNEGLAPDDPARSEGRFVAIGSNTDDGVLATRIPYIEGGNLLLFEIGFEPGAISPSMIDLEFVAPLTSSRLTDLGKTFRITQ